ncbi:hypothetical protein Mapa_003290 [Marchantia paleacea]|nr:hypothetical protein Mapa_003290 [Marchantia paleacea]
MINDIQPDITEAQDAGNAKETTDRPLQSSVTARVLITCCRTSSSSSEQAATNHFLLSSLVKLPNFQTTESIS